MSWGDLMIILICLKSQHRKWLFLLINKLHLWPALKSHLCLVPWQKKNITWKQLSNKNEFCCISTQSEWSGGDWKEEMELSFPTPFQMLKQFYCLLIEIGQEWLDQAAFASVSCWWVASDLYVNDLKSLVQKDIDFTLNQCFSTTLCGYSFMGCG